MFSIFTDYTSCSVNFFFKHIGISLFLLIFFIMINLNYELGNDPSKYTNKSFKFNIDKLDNISKSNIIDEKDNSMVNSLKYDTGIINGSYDLLKVKIENIPGNLSKSSIEFNENLIKKMKTMKHLFFESIICYTVNIIILILIIIKNLNNNNIKEIQNKKGQWSYSCILEKYDLIYSIIEFFVLLYILIRSNHLLKYDNIFGYVVYCTYSTIFGLLLGPLINVRLHYYF